MPMYGYARVSTNGQDLTAQDAELMAAGCAKVFREKASGAKTDRPELAKLIRRLEPGDVVAIVRLDRLARSTRDLLNVLDEISKRGAGFRLLRDAWANATGFVPWQPEETPMAKKRGGTATRGKQEDDLQRDDGGAKHSSQKSKKDLDKELDKTLEDSFPSSDPPAISQPTKTEPAGDPKVKP
jgi:hypothetical protein